MIAAVKSLSEPMTARKSISNSEADALTDGLENPHADMSFPNLEYRLPSLFRLWNVMHYFFAYKHLTDKPWDDVLTEFIPRFEAADSQLAYEQAVVEAATGRPASDSRPKPPDPTRHISFPP